MPTSASRSVPAAVLALLLVCAACEDTYVPTPHGGVRVLFIGSSATYWHEMPFVVAALSREMAEEHPLEAAVVAYGGFSLDAHWTAGESRTTIARGGWDLVVLEPWYLADPTKREANAEVFVRFAAEATRVGARPVIYMRTPGELASAEHLAAGLAWHLDLADRSGAAIVPVSEAWRAAAIRDPALVLREPDGHANMAGTYLTALTFYSAIYGRSPLGAPSRFAVWSRGLDEMDLPPHTASLLREAVAEVTEGYTSPIRAR